MKQLPYRAKTSMGEVFDIDFPLHDETGSPIRVGQLVSLLLDALDHDIAVVGETSNGDVLQACAMAMAIRAGMIHAPQEVTRELSRDLLNSALDAVGSAARQHPQSGHA